MKTVGLITEYNPFHNGHQFHIKEALRLTGADAAIVIMSGDFVQRGTPAILPKHLRAEMALKCGASLVLELPVFYATGSAEYFAYGAVSILHGLGCVDTICFGSECGDIEKLQQIASILANEPDSLKNALQNYLKQGFSFPVAREKALTDYTSNSELASVLSKPNNTLAIEYLKALSRLNSKIKPYTITRQGAEYHDLEANALFSSASAIRKQIVEQHSCAMLSGQVPEEVLAILDKNYGMRFPVFENDFSLLLKYKLLLETKDSLYTYLDVTPDLANRIIHQRNAFLNWQQFCEVLKTKELTYARISRVLLHILLDIRKEDTPPLYARVLGFSKGKKEILRKIKDTRTIPLITKLDTNPIYTKDIYASNLYESVVTEKYQTPFINEYQKQIVIIT